MLLQKSRQQYRESQDLGQGINDLIYNTSTFDNENLPPTSANIDKETNIIKSLNGEAISYSVPASFPSEETMHVCVVCMFDIKKEQIFTSCIKCKAILHASCSIIMKKSSCEEFIEGTCVKCQSIYIPEVEDNKIQTSSTVSIKTDLCNFRESLFSIDGLVPLSEFENSDVSDLECVSNNFETSEKDSGSIHAKDIIVVNNTVLPKQNTLLDDFIAENITVENKVTKICYVSLCKGIFFKNPKVFDSLGFEYSLMTVTKQYIQWPCIMRSAGCSAIIFQIEKTFEQKGLHNHLKSSNCYSEALRIKASENSPVVIPYANLQSSLQKRKACLPLGLSKQMKLPKKFTRQMPLQDKSNSAYKSMCKSSQQSFVKSKNEMIFKSKTAPTAVASELDNKCDIGYIEHGLHDNLASCVNLGRLTDVGSVQQNADPTDTGCLKSGVRCLFAENKLTKVKYVSLSEGTFYETPKICDSLGYEYCLTSQILENNCKILWICVKSEKYFCHVTLKQTHDTFVQNGEHAHQENFQNYIHALRMKTSESSPIVLSFPFIQSKLQELNAKKIPFSLSQDQKLKALKTDHEKNLADPTGITDENELSNYEKCLFVENKITKVKYISLRKGTRNKTPKVCDSLGFGYTLSSIGKCIMWRCLKSSSYYGCKVTLRQNDGNFRQKGWHNHTEKLDKFDYALSYKALENSPIVLPYVMLKKDLQDRQVILHPNPQNSDNNKKNISKDFSSELSSKKKVLNSIDSLKDKKIDILHTNIDVANAFENSADETYLKTNIQSHYENLDQNTNSCIAFQTDFASKEYSLFVENERSHIKYVSLKNGTSFGNPKVYDSLGFGYNLKRTSRINNWPVVVWHCTKGTHNCSTALIQTDGNFKLRGKHNHAGSRLSFEKALRFKAKENSPVILSYNILSNKLHNKQRTGLNTFSGFNSKKIKPVVKEIICSNQSESSHMNKSDISSSLNNIILESVDKGINENYSNVSTAHSNRDSSQAHANKEKSKEEQSFAVKNNHTQVQYVSIQKGTVLGNPKVYDSLGNRYTIRQVKENNIIWQCLRGDGKNHCSATLLQINDNFEQKGKHNHVENVSHFLEALKYKADENSPVVLSYSSIVINNKYKLKREKISLNSTSQKSRKKLKTISSEESVVNCTEKINNFLGFDISTEMAILPQELQQADSNRGVVQSEYDFAFQNSNTKIKYVSLKRGTILGKPEVCSNLGFEYALKSVCNSNVQWQCIFENEVKHCSSMLFQAAGNFEEKGEHIHESSSDCYLKALKCKATEKSPILLPCSFLENYLHSQKFQYTLNQPTKKVIEKCEPSSKDYSKVVPHIEVSQCFNKISSSHSSGSLKILSNVNQLLDNDSNQNIKSTKNLFVENNVTKLKYVSIKKGTCFGNPKVCDSLGYEYVLKKVSSNDSYWQCLHSEGAVRCGVVLHQVDDNFEQLSQHTHKGHIDSFSEALSCKLEEKSAVVLSYMFLSHNLKHRKLKFGTNSIPKSLTKKHQNFPNVKSNCTHKSHTIKPSNKINSVNHLITPTCQAAVDDSCKNAGKEKDLSVENMVTKVRYVSLRKGTCYGNPKVCDSLGYEYVLRKVIVENSVCSWRCLHSDGRRHCEAVLLQIDGNFELENNHNHFEIIDNFYKALRIKAMENSPVVLPYSEMRVHLQKRRLKLPNSIFPTTRKRKRMYKMVVVNKDLTMQAVDGPLPAESNNTNDYTIDVQPFYEWNTLQKKNSKFLENLCNEKLDKLEINESPLLIFNSGQLKHTGVHYKKSKYYKSQKMLKFSPDSSDENGKTMSPVSHNVKAFEAEAFEIPILDSLVGFIEEKPELADLLDSELTLDGKDFLLEEDKEKSLVNIFMAVVNIGYPVKYFSGDTFCTQKGREIFILLADCAKFYLDKIKLVAFPLSRNRPPFLWLKQLLLKNTLLFQCLQNLAYMSYCATSWNKLFWFYSSFERVLKEKYWEDPSKYLGANNAQLVFNCDVVELTCNDLLFLNEDCHKRTQKNLTVLCCVSGTGQSIKPLIITKSNVMEKSINQIEIYNKHNIIGSHEGNLNSKIFHYWLLQFDEELVRKEIPRPVILILNGSNACISYDSIHFAENRNIVLYFVPPNCSNELNPLTISVFPVLKENFSCKINDDVSIECLPYFFVKAYEELKLTDIAPIGFKFAGLCPYNCKILGKRKSTK